MNLLSGIQDSLQLENKYKALVRPVFSGVQVDNQGMHSIIDHLAVQLHRQAKTMDIAEEDQSLLESKDIMDLVRLQIRSSDKQLQALEAKMNPEGSKKKKQLGLGRGTREFYYRQEVGSIGTVLQMTGLLEEVKKQSQSRNEERRKPKIAKGTRDSDPQ